MLCYAVTMTEIGRVKCSSSMERLTQKDKDVLDTETGMV